MKKPPAAPGSAEAAAKRVPETRDIARRLKPIPPSSLTIPEMAGAHPLAAFNPALHVEHGTAHIYPRVVMGYYTYTSAVASIELDLADLLSGPPPSIDAKLAVAPSNWYDFWGAEDPRVYALGGRLYMTYTGRTANFFRGEEPLTLPVNAVLEGETWRPVSVYAPRPTPHMDKDAFAAEVDGHVFHMHRPELPGGLYIAAASSVEERPGRDGLVELEPRGEVSVDVQAGFEERAGWSAPPVEVEGRTVALMHGVSGGVYRVFAVELGVEGGVLAVKAVTPRYVMEPRMPYERLGDRPFTVFPCGAAVVDDAVLVSYGAGDLYVGLALLPVDELLAELDRGRVS